MKTVVAGLVFTISKWEQVRIYAVFMYGTQHVQTLKKRDGSWDIKAIRQSGKECETQVKALEWLRDQPTTPINDSSIKVEYYDLIDEDYEAV